MNPLNKLINQTAIYGLSSVIGRFLNYLLVPIYTRYFLPPEYGVVTELYAYVAFLVVFLTYGLETAFFRFTEKLKENVNVYSTILISLIFSSSIFIVLMFLNSQTISNWLGYGNHPQYIEWFAIIIGLDAISSISFAKLRQQEKAIKFALIRLSNIFINIGLNLYFIVFLELGIEYIFVANLISSVITFFMLSGEMINTTWVFDTNLWKKIMVYSLPLLIAGLAGVTNETIDRVLLKYLLPSPTNISELGLYGAFYKLSIIMTLFIQTFRFAAEPFFFAHQKENKSKQTYADVMKYFTIVMIIIFLIVVSFYDFIKTFLGNDYHDERGFLVVSVLLLANLFLGIYYNLSIWYKLTEKTSYGAWLSVFGAVITLIFNIILIPVIGFVGSAWATLACYFSMTTASYLLGKKYFYIPYQTKRILVYLFVMLALYILIYFLELNIWINSTSVILFIVVVLIIEKPNKRLILGPKK